jgi:hypothetical protein
VLASRHAYALAAAAGVALWLGTSIASGRREAWDSGLYWLFAYPAGIGVAATLGALAPASAWRWGLTLMLVQAVTLAALTSDWGLLPLGLILFAVLAVPPCAAASLAAWLARRGQRARSSTASTGDDPRQRARR